MPELEKFGGLIPGDLLLILEAYNAHLMAQREADLIAAPTADTYYRNVKRFLDWAEAHASADFLDYCSYLKLNFSYATAGLSIAAVRHFVKWGQKAGRVNRDFTADVRRPRRGVSFRRKMLDGSEVLRLLQQPGLSVRNRAMLYVLAYTGARSGELIGADLEHLHESQGVLLLNVQGKGRREHDEEVVIVDEDAQRAVRAYLSERGGAAGPLFQTRAGGRLSKRSMRKIVKDAYRAVGIVHPQKTTHSLRHSAISAAIQNGATLADVQSMARHRSPATTLLYLHQVRRRVSPAEGFIKYRKDK